MGQKWRGGGQAVSVGKPAMAQQEYLATWRENGNPDWNNRGLEQEPIPEGGSEFLEEAEETAPSSKAPRADPCCTSH